MEPGNPRLLTFSYRGRSFVARALVAAVGLAVAVAAFFFLTLALIVGAFIVVVLAVRWWWALRRIRSQQKASAALDGEYTVLDDAEVRRQRLER